MRQFKTFLGSVNLVILIETHTSAFIGVYCKFLCVSIVTFCLIFPDGFHRAYIRFDVVGKLSINFALVFRHFVRVALHHRRFSNMKNLETKDTSVGGTPSVEISKNLSHSFGMFLRSV